MPDDATSTRYDVTTIGETMLRFSPQEGERLTHATTFRTYVGGAESNVVAALAQLGRTCLWISRLPENPLGTRVLSTLRGVGVDTSGTQLSDGRMGLYFLEDNPPPLPTRVTYDRAHSAFSRIGPQDVDWTALLDTRILHLSGITFALGESCRMVATEALTRAHRQGVLTSFDVNFRNRLWNPHEARDVLAELLPYVKVLFCSRRDARTVFRCDGEPAEQLQTLRRRTKVPTIVMSLAEDGAIAWRGDEIMNVGALPTRIVSRPGAGDALAAGVLDGLLDRDFPRGLKRGVALASIALSQQGDMVQIDRDELNMLVSDATGEIDR